MMEFAQVMHAVTRATPVFADQRSCISRTVGVNPALKCSRSGEDCSEKIDPAPLGLNFSNTISGITCGVESTTHMRARTTFFGNRKRVIQSPFLLGTSIV